MNPINLTPLTEELYDYMLSVSLRDTDLLAQLRAETAKDVLAGKLLSPESAQFLAFLIKLIGAKHTIEVGVFTGYSALVVASALPEDGKIIACDIDEVRTAVAQRYWQQANVAHKIDLRLAPAQQTLQALLDQEQQNSFDFIFIDADKSNYATYVEQCHPLLRPGGLIAIDNTLWHSRVLDLAHEDEDTVAIRALNEALYQDERFDLSLVPIGDGLTLLRKR